VAISLSGSLRSITSKILALVTPFFTDIHGHKELLFVSFDSCKTKPLANEINQFTLPFRCHTIFPCALYAFVQIWKIVVAHSAADDVSGVYTSHTSKTGNTNITVWKHSNVNVVLHPFLLSPHRPPLRLRMFCITPALLHFAAESALHF
jgi:hypothetical protein